MRDLNEGADSSWSHHYGDRASGRHLHDLGHQIGRCNRNLGYDKESVKRTMLAHNATFRSQVYELHRIYDRHKEVIDQLKKKGTYGYTQAYASHSNSHSSQTPFDGSSRTRHVLHVSATSTSYKNNEKTSTLSFLKDGDVTDANCKEHSRRMFDLRLPADVYIDCDDVEKLGTEIDDESSSVRMFPLNGDHENDVRLALGTSTSFSYRDNSWKSDSCAQNEPLTENFFERQTSSVSYNFRTSFEENPTGSSTYPNDSYTYMKETSRERSFFDTDAGKTPSIMKLFGPVSSQAKFSVSYEARQLSICRSEKWHPVPGADTSYYRNGFSNRSFRPDYSSSSQVHLPMHRPMNLDQVLLNGVQICRTAQNNSAISDSKSKRIFGFSISDDTTASHREQPPVTESSHRSFRIRIDLNSDPCSWEIQDEAIVKEAAENIVRISSAKHSDVDDVACRPFDTLLRFAEIVSCEENSIKESPDDELDLFERTTLNLEETKPEECPCGRSEGEDRGNDDERTNDVMQRRGQGRKRRQRRDFRKDILPGLVSLARHEAADDIQTIAGLMKSTGQSWQPGATRRNAGRNAIISRARSRRPVAEAPISMPPPPVHVPVRETNGMEVGVERVDIVRWEGQQGGAGGRGAHRLPMLAPL